MNIFSKGFRVTINRGAVLFAGGALLGVLTLPAFAQETPGRRVVNLDEAIRLALQNNAEIKESKEGISGALGKKRQADAARFAQADLLTFLGPSPQARGNQVVSPDDVDRPTLNGVFTRAIVNITQPIFTFGEISGLREAASSGVRVEEARVQEKSSKVIVAVKQFYYGVILARELRTLAQEVMDQLDGAKQRIKELLDGGAVSVDEVALWKLEAFQGTVETGLHEAEKAVELALGALKFTLGFGPNEDLDVADRRLIIEQKSLESLPFYQERSFELRPEFTQIQEGLKALRALVRVEKSRYYPKFFVAALADAAEAGNRTDINNPFINDELNHETLGVAVGFKWAFNFGITTGKVQVARAEVAKLEHKKSFAEGGIPLEVKKAYEEVIEADKNFEVTETSYRSARKWLVASVANFDLGIGDPEEIFEALEQYAKMRVRNFQSMFEHNLAVAKLEHASGLLVVEVEQPGEAEEEKPAEQAREKKDIDDDKSVS
jgi:outer membrane protein TolC